MARMRTLKETLAYIKSKDPQTAVTMYFLRRLVLSGGIPVVKAGAKIMLNLDALEEHLSGSTQAATHQPQSK